MVTAFQRYHHLMFTSGSASQIILRDSNPSWSLSLSSSDQFSTKRRLARTGKTTQNQEFRSTSQAIACSFFCLLLRLLLRLTRRIESAGTISRDGDKKRQEQGLAFETVVIRFLSSIELYCNEQTQQLVLDSPDRMPTTF